MDFSVFIWVFFEIPSFPHYTLIAHRSYRNSKNGLPHFACNGGENGRLLQKGKIVFLKTTNLFESKSFKTSFINNGAYLV
jgi:hypothetical protein